MSLFWSTSRSGKIVEGALNLLEAAIGFGLVSGAVVAASLGKFILGGLLGVLTLGVVVRFKRRRNLAASKTRKGSA